MNLFMGIIAALYVVELGESRIALYFILLKAAFALFKIYKLRHQAALEPSSATLPGQTGESLHAGELRCMKLLGLVLIPLIVAFCVYRLIYEKYRSWYSWAILSLAACSEVFGFVTMTPQVFMNYRLKSVEHLPWRALSYQAVNTFIDDVFTLVIRMPEVQKFSVLRDDIVFIVCIYQRWLYKDRRRSGDDDDVSTIAAGDKKAKRD